MKQIKLTEKEIDAISCMCEYFINSNNGFITRYHKRFIQKEIVELNKKLMEPKSELSR